MILSTSFVVIGSIELLHCLSYQGIGIFPDISANPATQLWVAARYLEATAFLASALVLGRKETLSSWLLLAIPVLAGIGLTVSIWPLSIFPDCFIEPAGLTPFKVISEYVISALFGFSILIFWKKRENIDRRVLKLLTAAIIFSITAELAFTLYSDIYGITNFIGHFAKFLSVILLYRVLVIATLRSPYATLFRDLSLAKNALDLELEQRKETEVELRVANRELDAFVRTVSHDLRTPLTPIIGLPELMLEQLKDTLDDVSKKSLQDIRDQGLRMARILEDLLIFARAGRLTDSVASATIESVSHNVLEDLGSHIIEHGISLKLGEFPDVAFPRTALFQIFSNLINNAIKYAGKEGCPIELGGERAEGYVLLYVRDHGPGVPEESREKIFDVFYRGSVTQEEPGSGIGLATVLKIARGLGGDARVEETPGGGATFIVRLLEPESERQQHLNFNKSGTG